MKILRNRKLERFVVVATLVVTAAIAFAIGTQGRAERDASTAARIQRLEDIEEIRTLLVDYGRLLDAHDLAGCSRLFARDGEWIGGFGSAKGPTAIQALMEKNLAATPTSKSGSTYHLDQFRDRRAWRQSDRLVAMVIHRDRRQQTVDSLWRPLR